MSGVRANFLYCSLCKVLASRFTTPDDIHMCLVCVFKCVLIEIAWLTLRRHVFRQHGSPGKLFFPAHAVATSRRVNQHQSSPSEPVGLTTSAAEYLQNGPRRGTNFVLHVKNHLHVQ